ncbi:serine hydrolase domain-containing protein [Streptomyces sp. NPDC059866]|uniref:serine hydrolase domain-containing protein n=1 Tax=Streptomyces sp. NPDC059866 TaxID=3346978 RepID=UPI00366720FE
MRFSALGTAVLASAALVVPLAPPALASPTATVAAVAPETVPADQHEHGHGRHDDHRLDRGPDGRDREERARTDARLQKVLDGIVAAGAPGVVAEVRDGRQVWTGRSGKADRTRGLPPRTDSRFRAGSVTKSFVATVVLQLTAEGELRLDDPVERHLPGVVPNGGKITVRQLLGHRSGLFNYTDRLWPGGFKEAYENRFRHYAPGELIAEATRHRPLFAPGTSGSYSNTNYVLLGMLIEKVTGNSARTEIMRRIIGPLGLDGTSFPEASPRIPSPHARGYIRLEGSASPYTDMTETDMSWAWTAGALISTTHDLNIFYKALVGGRLLPAKLMKDMLEIHPLVDGSSYGLGVARVDAPEFGRAFGHTGGAPGFTTHSYTLANGSRQVTLSVNSMPVTEEVDLASRKATLALLAMGAKSN